MPEVDVLVAGGGPAGMAAAIRAADAGMSVVIAEPKAGPIDKACGEGLMPRTLLALEELGICGLHGAPFRGIRYLSTTQSGAARFSLGPGLGVRRTTLHQAMRDRTEALGVQWIEARITEWSEGPDWIEAAGTRARWLIAADGLQSGIRKHMDVQRPSSLPTRLGVRRHFKATPWSEYVDVHWRAHAEAYVTPVGPDTVGVGILYAPDAVPDGPGTPFERLMTLFPQIAQRLGEPCSSVAGAGPFSQELRTRQQGRVFLVGDASGYVDPMTGEGIRVGLDTAKVAVRGIQDDRPDLYDRAWARATYRYRWMTTAILRIRLIPMLQRLIVPVVARVPWCLRRAIDFLNGP